MDEMQPAVLDPTDTQHHIRPRRLYLLTYPRTASNLLTRILSLPSQPAVTLATNADGTTKDGYFFFRAMGTRDARQLWDKDLRDWTGEDRVAMRSALDRCVGELVEFLEGVPAGRIAFVKEHVGFMREPVVMARVLREYLRRTGGEGVAASTVDEDDESPWRASVPTSTSCSPLNETVLPDTLLRTFHPIFLIRHPALAFPSLYRTMRDLDAIDPAHKPTELQLMQETSLTSTRRLYEFFLGHFAHSDSAPWPLVVDAADLIAHPAAVAGYVARTAGLDETQLRFSWGRATEAERVNVPGGPGAQRMLDTLLASTGVIADKGRGVADSGSGSGSGVDVSREAEVWEKEFGPVAAGLLRRFVDDALPDWEFLWERRVRVA